MNTDKIADAVGNGVGAGVRTTLNAGVSIFNWGKSKVNKALDERKVKQELKAKQEAEAFNKRVHDAISDMELDLTPERKAEIVKEVMQKLAINQPKLHGNLTPEQQAKVKAAEAKVVNSTR